MVTTLTSVLLYFSLPLLLGWLLDKLLGDPMWLPHPIVLYGKLISWGERRFNKGEKRLFKGGALSICLLMLTFLISFLLLYIAFKISPILYILLSGIFVFYCLAGTTLIREVRMVFEAVAHSLEEGRNQVSRIVGRDTSSLSAQEVRTAALETLAENLSDGVIAPLFSYMILGVPGMLTYKMINTLDSMIGYKNERYLLFGRIAARIDDIANYIPARLTAFLMIVVSGKWSLWKFVCKYGKAHASPNSGYPEAALAGILNCRFGGPHDYFGEVVYKPYIGENERLLTTGDMKIAIFINQWSEVFMVISVILFSIIMRMYIL